MIRRTNGGVSLRLSRFKKRHLSKMALMTGLQLEIKHHKMNGINLMQTSQFNSSMSLISRHLEMSGALKMNKKRPKMSGVKRLRTLKF